MIAGIALFLFSLIPISGNQARPATASEFEKAAASETFLDLDCVVTDRVYGQDCTNQAATDLIRRDYPVSDLLVLTDHPDSRVRSLALACLFAKWDPRLLPFLFKLVDDPAPTFPAHMPVANLVPPSTLFSRIPQTAQTVGSVAEDMISVYLKKAGYLYGSHGSGARP